MIGIIYAIISAISASLVLQLLTAALVGAMIVWWDEWGADFLASVAAVICIVGIIYVGLAVGIEALAWTVAVEDIAVIAIAGVIGISKLAEWLMAAIKWLVGFVVELLGVLADAIAKNFPFLIPLAIFGLYLYLSPDEVASTSQPVFEPEKEEDEVVLEPKEKLNDPLVIQEA